MVPIERTVCVFRDTYTKEILGHHVHTHMTMELLEIEYGTMMEKHGTELHRAECVIHNDQCCYTRETPFREMNAKSLKKSIALIKKRG